MDVDELIQQLVDATVVGGSKAYRSGPRIADEVISYVCETAKALIMSQPCLLELGCPMKVRGRPRRRVHARRRSARMRPGNAGRGGPSHPRRSTPRQRPG